MKTFLKTLTALLVLQFSISNSQAQKWDSVGPGFDNGVNALSVYNGTLYAGGAFRYTGYNSVNYMAQWNGNLWMPTGSGMNSYVLSLTSTSTGLYAGGYFWNAGGNPASSIALWNGDYL